MISEHEKNNDAKWTKRSRTYDEGRFNYFRYMQKKLISKIDLHENINFLDIGCGTGWAVLYVAKMLNGKGNFIGIDIANGMIEIAQRKAIVIPNVKFIQASSEKLPIENDYIHNIICTNSFHHYQNPEIVMTEIYRVLKEGGRISILDVTSDDFIISSIDKKVRKKEKEHVRFYSTVEYQKMFISVGLKTISSNYLIYPMKIHIAEKA